MWWHTSVITTFGKLGQKDRKFMASLKIKMLKVIFAT